MPANPLTRTRPAVRGLRHVALWTKALDEAVEFYSGPWGLEVVHRGDGCAFLRASGPEHHVLELHAAERNGTHHIAFEAATVEDVDRTAAWLADEGIRIARHAGPLDEPGGGYGVRFLDHENRLIEVSALVEAVGERAQDLGVPRKVAHVVLNTIDIDASVAFYGRLLGLRVSDWSEHKMVFMRANADHHVVAFNQAEWPAPNHVAYEVADLDAFMRTMGRLRVAGHEPAWGPGRHGPGDNAFLYYVDPSGLVPETTAEVLQIDEATWTPRVWPRTPELSDLFRTAGPPTPHVRKHMAGEPDHGHARAVGEPAP